MLKQYAVNVKENNVLPIVVRYHAILKKYDSEEQPSPVVPGFRKLLWKYDADQLLLLPSPPNQLLPSSPTKSSKSAPAGFNGILPGFHKLLPKFKVDEKAASSLPASAMSGR